MTPALRAIILRWDYNRWVLLECAGNEPDREQREAWLAENEAKMPRPQRQLQETVSFRWSRENMRGEIRKICCYVYDGVPKQPINYEIYANGHGRSTYEDQLLGL